MHFLTNVWNVPGGVGNVLEIPKGWLKDLFHVGRRERDDPHYPPPPHLQQHLSSKSTTTVCVAFILWLSVLLIHCRLAVIPNELPGTQKNEGYKKTDRKNDIVGIVEDDS